MSGLYLKATKNTPLVVMDPATECFVIFGNSLPENAVEFYEPIFHWMDRNAAAIPQGAIFRFRLSQAQGDQHLVRQGRAGEMARGGER